MPETLILNRAEIRALVSPTDALGAMRDAFRLYSMERAVPALRLPSPLPAPAPPDASAMILVPGVVSGIPAYTVKVHAKHPGSDPAIQGIESSSRESRPTNGAFWSGQTPIRSMNWSAGRPSALMMSISSSSSRGRSAGACRPDIAPHTALPGRRRGSRGGRIWIGARTQGR
jgi:hypothetical protein